MQYKLPSISGPHCKPSKDTCKAVSTKCKLVPGSSYSLYKHKDTTVVDRDIQKMDTTS